MSAPKTNTVDAYKTVHKALRFLLFKVSAEIAKYDVSESQNLSGLKSDFDELSGWIHDHAGHEDNNFHDLLRDSHPDVFATLDADHEAAHQGWLIVERQAQEVFNKSITPSEWHSFYLNFNAFVVSYLTHLQYEESIAGPLLQNLATQEEMIKRVMTMLGTFTPAAMTRSKKWMLLSCNESELREMRLI